MVYKRLPTTVAYYDEVKFYVQGKMRDSAQAKIYIVSHKKYKVYVVQPV